MSIDGDGTIPVQSDKRPSQWTRNSWDMDEAGMSGMAEIQRKKVEEVEDQHELRQVESGSDEKHDECELEKIVQDEMASNCGGGINELGI